MAYHPILYRLLGVPDTGAEPSAYRLLGVDPRQCGPEAVRERLLDCRQRILRSIPGPQFIPIVAMWDAELAQAADLLLDPARRGDYDARLAREAGRDHDAAQARQGEQIAATVRRTLEAAVGRDGTLDDSRRRDVEQRLRAMRVPGGQIESSLAEIPRPAAGKPGPAAGAVPFFERAVDLSLNQGLLLPRDERALLGLAGKLLLPGETAAAIVERRLAARGAQRVAHDSSPPQATQPPTPALAAEPPAGAAAAGSVWEDVETERASRQVWPYAVAVVVAILFALVVAALIYLGPWGKSAPEPPVPPEEPPASAPATPEEPPTEPPAPPEEPPDERPAPMPPPGLPRGDPTTICAGPGRAGSEDSPALLSG